MEKHDYSENEPKRKSNKKWYILGAVILVSYVIGQWYHSFYDTGYRSPDVAIQPNNQQPGQAVSNDDIKQLILETSHQLKASLDSSIDNQRRRDNFQDNDIANAKYELQNQIDTIKNQLKALASGKQIALPPANDSDTAQTAPVVKSKKGSGSNAGIAKNTTGKVKKSGGQSFNSDPSLSWMTNSASNKRVEVTDVSNPSNKYWVETPVVHMKGNAPSGSVVPEVTVSYMDNPVLN